MLALLPSILSLLLMYFVQVYHDPNRSDDKRHLNSFSIISVITAAYLMLVIIGENIFTMGLSGRIFSFTLLLILLISPLTIVTRTQPSESSKILFDERKSLIEEETLSKDQEIQVPSPKGESLNLLQSMKTLDFWLLFIAMSCGMGSGLATVNNMSQIGSSLGYSTMATSTLVSLWSIWNFLGRFGSGYISDYMLHTRGWARPLFIALTLGTMSIGHLVISSALPGSLHIGSVLVGVCYGSQWALMPSITSELFGLVHFGTIFNSIAIASPVGSYIFSVRVVGYIYDREASESGMCIGRSCFMLSFLIMASVTLGGSFISFALFLRTRRFYKEVVCAQIQASTAL
ncbi:uncharacterized protein A4U43_C03F14940 [Asparagus officinalis]|uniref:Uncharacterized protein n=2 Tax=Asparagus officinalis TaxID=4686 RepID=A0A5P1FAQ7_ASPOF|nr:uncharacterized protein A4U43_C03F14940 [Asparagus officinalis]